MTSTPQEPGDQHPTNPAPPPVFAPYPDQPAYGYQPPPPPRNRKTALIVTGVIALVVGLGIGAGIMAIANDDDPAPPARADRTGSVPITTPPTSTTSTSRTSPDDGAYSMASVANACDLIDPTLVHKWASTPDQPPYNREDQPTSLACTVSFTALSTIDQTHYNQAGIELEAEFTSTAYETWKDDDTDTTGSGLATGEITDLGTQGYWHSEIDEEGDVGRTYIVAVQDDNVSIRIRLTLLRVEGEPPVPWEEMSAVAKSEAQLTLTALRT